jgi:uncharacterized protein
MEHEERQLITGLFDRMRGFGAVQKDRDADQLIAQYVRSMPDAPYLLVQSVLIQEQALQQADARMQELEARVQELETRPAPQASGGSFLGGLFGGGAKPAPASVPAMNRSAPAGSPWGQQPQAMQQPAQQYGQPQYAPQAQAAPAGGGFMKSAMATAAGVAGGMLVANSIQGMMNGGNHGTHNTSSPTPPNEPQYQQASNNDPAYDDAAQDAEQDASYDSGGDSGGGDMDI